MSDEISELGGLPNRPVGDLAGNPYLSVIMWSRNDDHGGNMLRRMQLSLNGLLAQLEEHHIESELILVDWNPPADKPLLKDVIEWPDKPRYCTIRVIVVPNAIHRRYGYSDKWAMNPIVAVNCGTRRARGQFILPSAMDMFRSDALISFIARKNLKTDERYRIDRCDVDRNAIRYDTLEEQLDFCEKNIIKINARTPRNRRWWSRWMEYDLPDLHTNACGDFQLMSRKYWHLLRGYHEASFFPAFGDSLLSFASYAAGVKEVILDEPMRLYHVDHDGRFNDAIREIRPPLQRWLSPPFMPARMSSKAVALYRQFLTRIGYEFKSVQYGIPVLHYAEYRKMARQMVSGKRSYVLNDEDWGLGQESLEEFVICAAEWDKEYERDT